MKNRSLLLILIVSTTVLWEIDTSAVSRPFYRTLSASVHKVLHLMQRGATAFCNTAFYNALWGSSPDITLPDNESKLSDDEFVRIANYPRDLIHHLTRVAKVKNNTRIRARTIGSLAGMAGFGIAYRICKGFHSNLSALCIAASGLSSGFGIGFLARYLINRRKRASLTLRTRTLLEQTPPQHLLKTELSIKQPIKFDNLGQILVAQKILADIDERTFNQMHSHWQAHSIASGR